MPDPILGFKPLALVVPVLVVLAGQVQADEAPMSGQAFDDFVTGNAYSYARNGVFFGTEAYRGQRQVLWLGADGTCLVGNWFAQDGQICFVYEIDKTGTPRVCVPIFAQGSALRAEESDGGRVIGVLTDAPDISACPGPEVGA